MYYVIRIATKGVPCYLSECIGRAFQKTHDLKKAKTFIFGMEAVEKIKQLEKDHPKKRFFWEEIKTPKA
jgi:hypothetical protein